MTYTSGRTDSRTFTLFAVLRFPVAGQVTRKALGLDEQVWWAYQFLRFLLAYSFRPTHHFVFRLIDSPLCSRLKTYLFHKSYPK